MWLLVSMLLMLKIVSLMVMFVFCVLMSSFGGKCSVVIRLFWFVLGC